MQSAECVVAIEDSIRVLTAQVVLHIFACERSASADHRKLQLLPLQVLNDVFHLQRRFHQQPAQPDCVGVVLLCGFDDGVAWLLDSEVDYPVSVI